MVGNVANNLVYVFLLAKGVLRVKQMEPMSYAFQRKKT